MKQLAYPTYKQCKFVGLLSHLSIICLLSSREV